MEGICGVFQSSLVGPWISGIGTLVAASTALFIYWKNRTNQQADLVARRKVIRAMLREHLIAALEHFESLGRYRPAIKGLKVDVLIILIDLKQSTRLFELQEQLAQFGEEEDVAVASFIERCRAYKREITKLQEGFAASFESMRKGETTPNFGGLAFAVLDQALFDPRLSKANLERVRLSCHIGG